jgi:hypothetical protein
MSSIVGICNKALVHLGNFEFIGDLTEASKEAKACKLFFPEARDKVLANFGWPFATRRRDLNLKGTAFSPWTYSYAYPTDCVAARMIDDGLSIRREDQKIPFTIEDDGSGDGRLIFTNQQNAVLIYTARIENPSAYPSLFEDALTWLLAADMAMGLTNKPELERAARERWMIALTSAVAGAKNETQDDVPPDAESIAARL